MLHRGVGLVLRRQPVSHPLTSQRTALSSTYKHNTPQGLLMPAPAFLVEDNALIRHSLIPTMEELGDTQVVGVAEGQDDAIAWLTRDHAADWRLAVIDLFLKDGSGLGIVEACQRRRPDQRVVVLSNYATPAMRERCTELGANAVFDKSSELEEFLAYCGSLSLH